MKVFVRRLLWFVCPVILVLLFFEIFLRKMDTSYTVKREQVVTQGKDAEVLILGNSHGARLDPRAFSQNAFNLAQVNQSLYFDKRITLKYLEQFRKVKYALISVDFHSLYFSDEGVRNIWSYYGYGIDYKNSMSFAEKVSYLAGYKSKFLLEFLKRSWVGKYKVIRGIEVESEANLQEPMVKGFVPYVNSTNLNERYNRERAAFFNNIVRTSKERPAILADLDNFIAGLKQRGITPVLITLPCYGPYRDLLDKQVQARNRVDVLGLTDKYRIPYWDYSTMALPDNCYLDCDHLNAKGSLIVSRVLSRKVDELRAEKNRPGL